MDAGGNLDRVRSLLQEEGKTELKEFLTTKTVDKLTLGELKKVHISQRGKGDRFRRFCAAAGGTQRQTGD